MAVDFHAHTNTPVYTRGSFVSAGSPADVTETVDYPPGLVILIIGSDDTPKMYIKHAGEDAETYALVNHDTAQQDSVADASGITISGNTFTVDSTIQTASKTNVWMCFR